MSVFGIGGFANGLASGIQAGSALVDGKKKEQHYQDALKLQEQHYQDTKARQATLDAQSKTLFDMQKTQFNQKQSDRNMKNRYRQFLALTTDKNGAWLSPDQLQANEPQLTTIMNGIPTVQTFASAGEGVDKKNPIAGFHRMPNGQVAISLNTDHGVQPMTEGRTSHPNDPVLTMAPEDMVKNLQVMFARHGLTSRPTPKEHRAAAAKIAAEDRKYREARLVAGIKAAGKTVKPTIKIAKEINSDGTETSNSIVFDSKGTPIGVYDARGNPISQTSGTPATSFDAAIAQATKEAGDKAKYLNSDAEDFGPAGRQKWITDRAKEMMGESAQPVSRGKARGINTKKTGNTPPAKITTKAQYIALPKGARFVNPATGKVQVK